MAYGDFAEIYDELIYEDINYDSMCSRIIEICNRQNITFDNYLDIACGTGNLCVKLAKNFKEAFAVDLSEDMLREAFEKFKKAKIRCKILCQDMSELSLNRKFNLITSALDSTNYLIEEDKLTNYFKRVKEHLSDDGLFIFDINSYYKLSNILGNNIYTYNEEEVFYTWENVFEDDLLSMYLTFFVKRDDLYERFEEEHLERAYTEEFIEEKLKSVGLNIVGKYDGYTENSVTEETERILYIVKK
ncbi:MAG: class I SAM-dependent methyltransferase [Clostridium sp.]|nr:class I SAM-dependent methyltransferase [Clostridium sp.]